MKGVVLWNWRRHCEFSLTLALGMKEARPPQNAHDVKVDLS